MESCLLAQSPYLVAASMYDSISESTAESTGAVNGGQGAANAESRSGIVGVINCGFDDAHPLSIEVARSGHRMAFFSIG